MGSDVKIDMREDVQRSWSVLILEPVQIQKRARQVELGGWQEPIFKSYTRARAVDSGIQGTAREHEVESVSEESVVERKERDARVKRPPIVALSPVSQSGVCLTVTPLCHTRSVRSLTPSPCSALSRNLVPPLFSLYCSIHLDASTAR